MNDRSIELYREAATFAYQECKKDGRPGGPEDTVWMSLAMGRFAELVVRECAGLLDGEWEKDILCGSDAAGILKQHFGIEE